MRTFLVWIFAGFALCVFVTLSSMFLQWSIGMSSSDWFGIRTVMFTFFVLGIIGWIVERENKKYE